MRIKLDENLPAGLVEALAKLGHDVDSVPQREESALSSEDSWKSLTCVRISLQ
jgi:Domain of unknown function (DUF5615)